MNDEELAYWGQRGREINDASEILGGSLVLELQMIWRVLGAVIERMDLE